MSTTAELEAHYSVLSSSGAELVVRPCPDIPGLTAIIAYFHHDGKRDLETRITVDDDTLPLLIKALMRRQQDIAKDPTP